MFLSLATFLSLEQICFSGEKTFFIEAILFKEPTFFFVLKAAALESFKCKDIDKCAKEFMNSKKR